MKKYYVALLKHQSNTPKANIITKFIDFKEISSQKEVHDLAERCNYVYGEGHTLLAYSLVGDPSPPVQPPINFKKSPISEKEISFLKELESRISKKTLYGTEWTAKLSDTDIKEIKKIIKIRTDVYILPLTLDMGFSVGYQIKQVPEHYRKQ
jgi:hypothetical protein